MASADTQNASKDMTAAAEDPIVIVGMARTPIGAFQGKLATLSAPLSSAVLPSRRRCSAPALGPATSNEVLMGCVPPAGLGRRPPARRRSPPDCPTGLPCNHRQQDVRLGHEGGHDGLRWLARAPPTRSWLPAAWRAMTNAPYLLPKLRAGARLGHAEVKDHMFSTASRMPMRRAD